MSLGIDLFMLEVTFLGNLFRPIVFRIRMKKVFPSFSFLTLLPEILSESISNNSVKGANPLSLRSVLMLILRFFFSPGSSVRGDTQL